MEGTIWKQPILPVSIRTEVTDSVVQGYQNSRFAPLFVKTFLLLQTQWTVQTGNLNRNPKGLHEETTRGLREVAQW